MIRKIGTNLNGSTFDSAAIEAVWNKAFPVVDIDESKKRKDICGAWIERNQYGTTNQTGWEIDHIKPVASNGTDAIDNLQPLQWGNNRNKGDSWPNWKCKS